VEAELELIPVCASTVLVDREDVSEHLWKTSLATMSHVHTGRIGQWHLVQKAAMVVLKFTNVIASTENQVTLDAKEILS